MILLFFYCFGILDFSISESENIQKKRDCTVAVPLYEALVLPFIPNKQHRSPRRYARTRTCYKGTSEMMYTSREHQMPQCLGIKIEFTRFRKAKNKALMTPF